MLAGLNAIVAAELVTSGDAIDRLTVLGDLAEAIDRLAGG